MVELSDKTEEKQKPQLFKPGQSGNPNGRPKGTKNYITQLEEAIKKYETETGKQLFERLIQRAFINDNVLLNVVKKFIPDKTSTEITGNEGQPVVINLIPVKTKEDIKNLDNG